MPRRRIRALLSVLLIGAAACSTAADAPPGIDPPTTTSTAPAVEAAEPPHGSTPTIGDPYFPELGNPDIDVAAYELSLTVDPDRGEIVAATALLEVVALASLPMVSLDLVGLEVVATHIGGDPVPHVRHGGKLVLLPNDPLPAGAAFSVTVDYRGVPDAFFIPGIEERAGWVVTAEGLHVVAQPDGARTWFPGNDHPSDKARFTIAVTVPDPFVAVSNGVLVERSSTGGFTRFVWHMDRPMATYLATVVVGELVAVDRGTIGEVTVRDFLPTDLAGSPPTALDRTHDVIAFLETWFGPFPFTTYGHVVVPDTFLAFEAQTMTVLGRFALHESVVVHEIAHHWFGNSVTPSTWRDIWLSEGFASFAELLWIEAEEGNDALLAEVRRRHAVLAATPHAPVTDPGVDELFGIGVYWRGSLALHALRRDVGDDAMRRILSEYASRFAHGNATTSDFSRVAAEIAGSDVDTLLGAWLHDSELPPLPD